MSDRPAGDLTDELVAYLDGELDPATRREVEAKVSLDPAVRAEVEAHRRAWEMLDFLPRPEASGDFTAQTVSRLEISGGVDTNTMPMPGRRRWAWAALLVISTLLAVAAAGRVGYAVAERFAAPAEVADGDGRPQVPIDDVGPVQNLPTYLAVGSKEFLRLIADEDWGEPEPGPRVRPLPADRARHIAEHLERWNRLSEAERGRLRELHKFIHSGPEPRQWRMWITARQYEAWLADQDARTRERLARLGPVARARQVRAVRRDRWVADLSLAQRDEYRRAPESRRAELVGRWRDEARWRDAQWDWARKVGAARQTKEVRWLRGLDANTKIDRYVNDKLRPELTPGEVALLNMAAAERKLGNSVGYLLAIAELASRHEGAGPPPGPDGLWRRFADAKWADPRSALR